MQSIPDCKTLRRWKTILQQYLFGEEISRFSTIHLPEQLLYELFLRLPVNSLIRFRCVSKGMREMIDSSFFIKHHNIQRERSVSDDDYALLLYQPGFNLLFSVNFDKDNPNRAKAIELNCTLPKKSMFPIECCNGVFCFMTRFPERESCYVLWNPSNDTSRKVEVDCAVIPTAVSLGYDHVNDDYKIVRFTDINETSMEVYSFQNDSWRNFHMDFPSGKYGFTRGVCLNGIMHWLWINRTDNSIFIAAFDLATETFTLLPLPLDARQLNLEPRHFTDFGGRLCVTFWPSRVNGVEQTVWVMEKYGIESSWTRLYSINHHTAVWIKNFYLSNSKRRFLCNFRRLSWWDPQDSSFERIEFTESYSDQLMCREAFIYVRNLVRLDLSKEPRRLDQI